MYGPPSNGMTESQLDDAIKELELKIYGTILPKDESENNSKLIYDVESDRLIKRI